MSLFNTGPK